MHSWAVYNIFRDHLGTITHLKTGSTVTEYSFDAWGRRRDKDDWTYTLTSEPAIFADRGFTGHEYLEDFKLYNMNGRLYDPVVGRFLSPDPYVQDPGFTQSLNRYSYCLNNPLKFTDPSGNTWWSHFKGWIGNGFDNLGKWWTKNNIPMIGVNISGNGTVPYAGVQGPGNTTISIGYNTKIGQLGLGNNSSGFTNFYYPFYDYNKVLKPTIDELTSVRAQHGDEWRGRSNTSNVHESGMINNVSFLIDGTSTLATRFLVNEYKMGGEVVEIVNGVRTISRIGKVSTALNVGVVTFDVMSGNVQSSTVADIVMIGGGIVIGVTIGPITAGVVGVIYGGTMLIGGQDAINNTFNGDWNSQINKRIRELYGR